MNLQHAKNNPGKFHQMRAKATKFDVKQGDYGFYALGTLKDELGNEEKVLFAVKKGETLVDASSAKELSLWAVRYDANDGNMKAYYNGSVAKKLQGSPQSPPQPAQATNPPGQGNNDVDIRKCLVCAYISSGKEPLAEDVEYWTKYIKTGKDASLPGNKSEPEGQRSTKVTDDDIPF